MADAEDSDAVAARRAGAGATWLDEHWPADDLGQWHDVIDIPSLDMTDPCICMLGQLGIALAKSEGATINGIDIVFGDGFFASGYSLLIDDDDEFIDAAEAELAACVRTRLGVMGPVDAESLGMDGWVPNRFWLAEIEKRRNG